MHRLNDESQVWMLTGTGNNLRKAKLKPYKILKRYVEFQQAFMKFGDSKIIEDNIEQQDLYNVIQSFICYLYNVENINDVDAARQFLSILIQLNNGWILENDEYHFKWFEGDQLPTYVSESLKTVSEAGEEDDVDNDEFREWSSSDDENENVNINDDNEEDF
ncbi:hypothetical protein HF086_003521 [Spodoptera exigua]|uniref:Uncharacterized protein n=1 Tax=Spodoptera exigua TaxID=7107 RepID=A0A922MR44_SPOEX|nr:hypothetical protein HF086_003521 [Spodoptera exigua]